jgi:hypothetical protein
MKTSVLLALVIFLSGCGAATQIAQVHNRQQHPSNSCRLLVSYNCPQPVVGQPYSCAPTVSEECQ